MSEKTLSDEEIADAMKGMDVEDTPTPVVPAAAAKVEVGAAVVLKRYVEVDQLKKDVAINPNDLDTAMTEHASLYVKYAVDTVNARRQHERLKHACEILEARLDAEYRESLLEGGKKVTEAAIRNSLVADKRWSAAQARVIEAQSIWKLCEVAENAMSQRKDLILEIARDRRKEREGQMQIKGAQDMRDHVLSVMSKTGT